MTSLPEQFSAARKWQLDTQFDFFRVVTTQVIESTEQVIALNIDTSRAAVERSADTVRQLFSARDPRDLLNLGGQGQEQFQQMLAYTRELFTIMAGARARLASRAGATPAPTAGVAAAPQAAPADARIAPEETEAEVAAKRVKPSKKPVVATEPQAVVPEPAAAEKPIARAAGKLAPKAAAAQHPMASPVVTPAAEVAVPPVKPVEAAPPPAPASGTPEIDARQAQLATFKNGRKK